MADKSSSVEVVPAAPGGGLPPEGAPNDDDSHLYLTAIMVSSVLSYLIIMVCTYRTSVDIGC